MTPALRTLGLAAALAAAATTGAHAQPEAPATASAPTGAAPTSAAKRQLIARVLDLQRPSVEGAARQLVEQSLGGVVQGGRQLLQSQVPADKRESTATAMDAEIRKYREEMTPPVRERAVRLAPEVLAPLLEARFNEDELNQLVAWLESPVNRKYQQLAPEMQASFSQRLLTESRPVLEPRLRALGERLGTLMGLPAGEAGSAASAPAPTASGPAAARP